MLFEHALCHSYRPAYLLYLFVGTDSCKKMLLVLLIHARMHAEAAAFAVENVAETLPLSVVDSGTLYCANFHTTARASSLC